MKLLQSMLYLVCMALVMEAFLQYAGCCLLQPVTALLLLLLFTLSLSEGLFPEILSVIQKRE